MKGKIVSKHLIWLIPLLSTILGGGVMSFVQFLIIRHDEHKRKLIPVDKFDKLVLLTLAQVQARLVTKGDAYRRRNSISLRDWAVYDEVYQHYADLGGNHFAEEMHKEVEKLPRLEQGGKKDEN
ncbi:hypothetical protein [Mogibacterium diversum]|uniref:hypothetical protein n=1 Tax=Mogibacterium diversum TaxID=114527 RepID=UPI0028EE8F0A|nr:hypothetical protein [Mogibacterium diversum]